MSVNSTNMQTSVNQAQKSSLAKELGTSVALSGAFTGGFGALSSVKNHGIKGSIGAIKANNKAVNSYLEKNSYDVFTKSIKASENYSEYTGLAKKAAKLEKINKKAADGKLSIWQNIKKLFVSDKNEYMKGIQKTANDAAENAVSKLNDAKAKLSSGQGLVQAASGDLTENAGKQAGKLQKVFNSAKKNIPVLEKASQYTNKNQFLSNTKNLFKKELTNKTVLFFTALMALPRIQEEIIPAFKNEGIISGIKTTCKVVARTGVDFISNAGFSAVGRALGSFIGFTIGFGPAGAAVGGQIGDVVGSFFSMKFISKFFDKKKEDNSSQTIAQNYDVQENNTQLQSQTYAENINTAEVESKQNNNSAVLHKNTSKYEGMTSRYKGPRPSRQFIA